ncbi:Guanylate-binding protein 7, partial [Durusdinium trenchii]
MPVAERALKTLKCVNPRGDEVDVLLLKWPADSDAWAICLPCRVSSTGIILAVPGDAIPEEDLERGQQAAADDLMGPNAQVTVSLQENADQIIEVQLVEFTLDVRHSLERRAPRSRRQHKRFADSQDLPNFAELDDAVEGWVMSGSLRDTGWQTAQEAPVPEPQGLDQVLAALAKLESRMDQLQRKVDGKPSNLHQSTVAKDKPGKKVVEKSEEKDWADILKALKEEVGPRPSKVLDEPAARTTAQELVSLVEEEMAASSSTPSVDDMMKLSMLKLLKDLQGKTSKKSKKLPGLIGGIGSSSEEEGGETWSSTSRGGKAIEAVEKLRAAMKQNPGAYLERMEMRMQRAVGAEEMGPTIPEKFIQSVPVGRSRTAGYALTGFATIHKLMLEGKARQARLHTVRMMAAMEQFLLDESWGVASRLTGVEEPPWAHWASQDLPSIRKQYIYTRLMDATWIGAIINELKEEEWPYLSEKFREIYENPDVILKAPEDMPPPMHIKGKEVRRAFHARVWGAEVEGIAGLIGPARNKLLKLAQLSVLMTEAGPVDEKMIEVGEMVSEEVWRRGDKALIQLDELQGLPRAYNRWFLLVRDRALIERGRVTARTQSIRQDLLTKLEVWLATQLPEVTLEDLARHHIDVLSEWLEEYMVTLYLDGQSRRSAAETLNVVVQKFGWLRSSLAAPWSVLKTWDMLEPVTHHPPMPVQVLYALAGTAMAWQWPHFAALLVLGFFGLLRPSELIGLRRQDLSLPQDHWGDNVIYVRVSQPKTRFRAAAAQHVRLDEAGIAGWVQTIFGSMPMWRKLWPGGATYLFRLWSEDLVRVQWFWETCFCVFCMSVVLWLPPPPAMHPSPPARDG